MPIAVVATGIAKPLGQVRKLRSTLATGEEVTPLKSKLGASIRLEFIITAIIMKNTYHSIITRLVRNLMHILRLLHSQILIHIHAVRLAKLKQVVHAPALAINIKVGERFPLRIHPLERENLRVGMANNILGEHVEAVPLVQPPELAVLLGAGMLAVERVKGGLAQLVEAVHLVRCVNGCDVGVVAETPEVVLESGHGGRVLAQPDHVLSGDGEGRDVFERLPHCLADWVPLGQSCPARSTHGGPHGSVERHVVQVYLHGFGDRCFGFGSANVHLGKSRTTCKMDKVELQKDDVFLTQ